MLNRLVDRTPQLAVSELIGQLKPPPMFDSVSFDTYIPDPSEPSQAAAVAKARAFGERLAGGGAKRGMFRKKSKAAASGLYLDGGFGVGKTHLLASIYHAAPEPKLFGTFVELTHVVGVLGYVKAVEELSHYSVVCIDEFELDDPGDTMLISRLLSELSAAGVSIVCTSNTLPGQLGEGRFAAQDFLREIKRLGDIFEAVRVDGPDYRHRDLPPAPEPTSDDELTARAEATPGSTLDDFGDLCEHLSTLHPSRYGRLIEGLTHVFLKDVEPADDQAVALRIVVLVDRLYDASIPVTTSGVKLDEIFTSEMMHGGYRKKYLRATSRLLALSRTGAAVATTS